MTCYICDPANPDADAEGCSECDREHFAHLLGERTEDGPWL